MEKNQNIEEPELRWIETPKGRAIINAVSLTVLLAITQHFGYIAPGPPVTLENIIRDLRCRSWLAYVCLDRFQTSAAKKKIRGSCK